MDGPEEWCSLLGRALIIVTGLSSSDSTHLMTVLTRVLPIAQIINESPTKVSPNDKALLVRILNYEYQGAVSTLRGVGKLYS